MTPITKTITAVLFIGLFVTAMACEANTKRKFHLVYLVSVMDLKSGSKVYVDPLFFTDGKKTYGFQYNCYGRVINTELINKKDMVFVKNYCADKTYTINPSRYYIQNNYGGGVRLRKITFLRRTTNIGTTYMVGKSSVLASKPNTTTVPTLKRRDGAPEFFFLMSRNQKILNQLMPRSKMSSKDIKPLLKRAKKLSLKALERIMHGTAMQISEEDKIKNKKIKIKAKIYNPLFADIDLDGKADLVMGTSGQSYSNGSFKSAWKAVGYVMGNGETHFGRSSRVIYLQPREGYKSPVETGFTFGVPLLFLRIADCNYILRYVLGGGLKQPWELLFENTRFPLGYGSGCRDKVIFRFYPDA